MDMPVQSTHAPGSAGKVLMYSSLGQLELCNCDCKEVGGGLSSQRVRILETGIFYIQNGKLKRQIGILTSQYEDKINRN
jgi:hypothetical protein